MDKKKKVARIKRSMKVVTKLEIDRIKSPFAEFMKLAEEGKLIIDSKKDKAQAG
jgi:hypothetical protein